MTLYAFTVGVTLEVSADTYDEADELSERVTEAIRARLAAFPAWTSHNTITHIEISTAAERTTP